jgi:hypothetical protein
MSAAMGILLMAGMTSCANEDVPTDTTNEGDYEIEFFLQTTDNAETRTTIDWDNLPEEEGNAAENYLDVSSLKIFFFKHNFPNEYWVQQGNTVYKGRWATVNDTQMPEIFTLNELKLNDLKITSTDGGAYVKGTLTGTWLTDTWPDKDFKMYVEANYYGTSAAESSSSVNNDASCSGFYLHSLMYNDKFSFSEDYAPSKKNPIPMAGMITCTNLALTQGKVCHLGTINLIRALAKIEVYPDPEYPNTQISNVKLQRCYDKGTVNPYYATTGTLGILDELEVPTDANLNVVGEGQNNTGNPGYLGVGDGLTNMPLNFLEHKDENGKVDMYYIYLPEYRITGSRLGNNGRAADSDNHITLTVNGYPYSLYFREYEDEIDDEGVTVSQPTGNYFNIIRNHIYRYRVSQAKKPGGDLSLKYMVIPWTNYTAPTITFE